MASHKTMQVTESELIRKLKLIEALHRGATTPGEKAAAAEALKRVHDRIQQKQQDQLDKPIPYTFSTPDDWRRQLLIALLKKNGIESYRYSGQRHTTVRAEVSKRFVDKILWPQYEAMSEELSKYLDQATQRIIKEAIHQAPC
jgi:tRNA nucleotidyltransferase (CCA-adding enzyme)